MQLTGAEIIIECLKEQKVDTVFGYPGGAILNVYDALYKHSNEIHHVLTSHEQGASHAGRWLCPCYRKSRSMSGNLRPGGHKSGYRYCNRIHGFCSGGGNHRERRKTTPWKRFLPGG